MGRIQATTYLLGDVQSDSQWQCGAISDHVRDGRAAYQLHCDEWMRIGLAKLERSDDVRVRHASGELYLLFHTFQRLRVRAPWTEGHDLDRHRLFQLTIECPEDHTHAASAELLLELVAACED